MFLQRSGYEGIFMALREVRKSLKTVLFTLGLV